MGYGKSALLMMLLSSWAFAQEQVPLPVKRSTILRKGGVTYYVEGRQKIPRGCEISIQKVVYIVGRGDAVLEVEGSLQIHGVSSREVIIGGVWIEPSKHCEDIHLDMVKFRKSGGVRAPAELGAKGKLFIENVLFEQGTRIDVTLAGGRIDLSSVGAYEVTRVTGIIPKGKPFSSLVVNIRGCALSEPPNGFVGGLFVTGARDVTVRINYMAGPKSAFTDCGAVTFDGNKVMSQELLFRQSRAGRFQKTKLQKCDIYSTRVTLSAPEGRKENVLVDKCWFKGLTKKDEILTKIFKQENSVRVKFGKINKRALELAGPLER